jgi:hypothetical protein
MKDKNAKALGKKGGLVKSEAKAKSSRKNLEKAWEARKMKFALPKTKEQEFQEAHDQAKFEESVKNGEVCIHGDEMGKCLLWCEGNPEAKKEMGV